MLKQPTEQIIKNGQKHLNKHGNSNRYFAINSKMLMWMLHRVNQAEDEAQDLHARTEAYHKHILHSIHKHIPLRKKSKKEI